MANLDSAAGTVLLLMGVSGVTYVSFAPRRRLLVSLGWLLIISVVAGLPVRPPCAAMDKAKEIEVHIERPDGTDWAYPADAIPVCAWGFPSGGTYRWSAEGPGKAIFAADVGSTWMSVTEPGKYKVSLQYSLDGRTATDTKGTVIALEAGAKDGGGPEAQTGIVQQVSSSNSWNGHEEVRT